MPLNQPLLVAIEVGAAEGLVEDVAVGQLEAGVDAAGEDDHVLLAGHRLPVDAVQLAVCDRSQSMVCAGHSSRSSPMGAPPRKPVASAAAAATARARTARAVGNVVDQRSDGGAVSPKSSCSRRLSGRPVGGTTTGCSSACTAGWRYCSARSGTGVASTASASSRTRKRWNAGSVSGSSHSRR
jgi:hypothetical protein